MPRANKKKNERPVMSAIQKLFNRNLLTRFVTGLGAVPQRFRETREERKPAIHPSFMDDFGA